MPYELAWVGRHQKIAAWAAAFLLFLVLNDVQDVQTFYWDADFYWHLSRVRALLHFPSVMRGYFYPLMLAPSRLLCDLFPDWGYGPFRVISSTVYAYVLTGPLPEFYQTAFGRQTNLIRRMIVPVLVAVIYPGLVVTTLSDLPAACLMLGSMVCAMRSVAAEGRSLTRHGLLLLSGMLAYGAYNTRTIYLFAAALMLPAVPFILYRARGNLLRLAALSSMILGIVMAAIPQLLINVKNQGAWSPAVIATVQGKSLFASQLLWGITFQRYETTIDPSVPGPEVYYPDVAGQRLHDALHIDADSFTVADYLGIVVHHPLDFAGIYGRHLVNGLDVRDGAAYTRVQSASRNGFAFCNFLVVFLGSALLLTAAWAHPPVDGPSRICWTWACMSLMPVLMIVPGAIETRFFLPLHLAFYSAIAFSAEPRRIAVALRRHWLPIAAAFGVSAAIFFAITLNTMASVEYGPHRVHIPAPVSSKSDSTFGRCPGCDWVPPLGWSKA